MDRKMDSGYLEPGETMDDDYDFSRVLLPAEIIGIIDQLLCHEVSETCFIKQNGRHAKLGENWFRHI